MMSYRKLHLLSNLLRSTASQIEAPIVYLLTFITATVNLLVYGATLLRGGDGLFDGLRPFFGVPFFVAIGACLIAVFVINQRWKMLVVILLGEVIHFLVLINPTGVRSISLAEYFRSSVTIACILSTACIYCHLIDNSQSAE